MAGEKETRKKKGFWNAVRILLFLFLVLGIIIGAALEHYFVEGILSADKERQCSECLEKQDLLNETINTCIADKKAVEKELAKCLAS